MDRCLNAARTALQQREDRLQEAFSYVERDLRLLGATGVEDKYGSKRINQNNEVLSLRHVLKLCIRLLSLYDNLDVKGDLYMSI